MDILHSGVSQRIGPLVSVVVVAALCSVSATATRVQHLDPPTQLGGPWRCFDGDDPAFATATFDDTAWTTVTVPETGARVCGAAVSWFRTRIDVDETMRSERLGVSVGIIEGGYEMFVDGVSVGGDVSLDGESLHVGRAFVMPPGSAEDGGLVVALRVVNHPAIYQIDPGRKLLPSGPFAVGGLPGVADRAELIVAQQVQTQSSGYIAFLLLVVFVALYHTLVWLLRRQLRGYFWFAITTIMIVAWMGLTNLHSTKLLPLSAVTANVWGNFAGSLVNAVFVSFVWRFVPRKAPSRPWRALQLVLVGIAFIGFLPDGLALTVWPPVIVIKVLTPLLALIQLVFWAVKGAPDARLLIFGTATAAVVAPLEVYFRQHGIHLTMTPAQMGFISWILVMAVGLARQFSRTLSDVDQRNLELRTINSSIARFVPLAFLQALGKKSVAEVERGEAQQHEMAVMFCDIRGFTTITESIGPQETFKFINEYLSRMEPEIYRGAGFINQYLGDGIMALFPSTKAASAEERSGADGAVVAALGMVQALDKLNAERALAGKSAINIGAGIHIGTLMIGTIGGGEQLNGGVVGDCVNASARLEGMTKMYNARVLISGSVVARLVRERPTVRHLDTVVPKGKSEPMLIAEILNADPHEALKKQSLNEFIAAQRAYQSGAFDEAIRLFQRCLEICPADGAARLLMARCTEMAAHPPEHWTGIYTMTTK